MKKTHLHHLAALLLALKPLAALRADEPSETPSPLWSHVEGTEEFGELRAMTAQWSGAAPARCLTLTAPESTRVAWAVIPAPKSGWDLARRATVEAKIRNVGGSPASLLLWVVGDRGWDAVPDVATLAPGESRVFSCQLREAFPDGTPKLDPGQVKQVQIMMIGRIASPLAIEVRALEASGNAPPWRRPAGRIDVPSVADTAPAPGHRVRYRLPVDRETGIYSVLQLPEEWRQGGRYPVIVEYPGNLFFVKSCYSTGLPDQCVIGYGMTKGRGAICLGLPFVDREAGALVESGWGNADDTADYAVQMVNEVCARFGGDRDNVVLTGFSRGALACGYIGLRNNRIAALWKGFHACQHYDGDGWRGATMEGALERARRFRGQAVFQTDNSQAKFQPLMDAMQARATFVRSELGAHSTAMFLDDRPSTQQLRQWYAELVGLRQP